VNGVSHYRRRAACRWRIPIPEQQGRADNQELAILIPHRVAWGNKDTTGFDCSTRRHFARAVRRRHAHTSRRRRRVIEPTTVQLPAIRAETREGAALVWGSIPADARPAPHGRVALELDELHLENRWRSRRGTVQAFSSNGTRWRTGQPGRASQIATSDRNPGNAKELGIRHRRTDVVFAEHRLARKRIYTPAPTTPRAPVAPKQPWSGQDARRLHHAFCTEHRRSGRRVVRKYRPQPARHGNRKCGHVGFALEDPRVQVQALIVPAREDICHPPHRP
jgi:hypothetical protein